MTTDNARLLLSDDRAPADEKFAALAELQKALMPTTSDLVAREEVMPLVELIRESYAAQEMEKSLQASNVVPFPSMAVRKGQDGMQSVRLDDTQVGVYGDYYEKPGAFGFDAMRTMVDQTPILSAVIMTRIHQVERFTRFQENGKGPGFEIRLRDRNAFVGDTEKKSIDILQNFIANCGFESNPRARAKLKRDSFPTFMAKQTRDTLTLDSMPIETEFKRNKKMGMDGFYAVDGATIRLCTEEGYRGDDEINAIQVVQGQIRTVYTFDDLVYVPRNPRSDVLVGGYGLSETELLVKVITNLLNAMTYNGKFFDSNQIPKGILHLAGNYSVDDIASFKRMWNAMVKGINNQWSLPVMVSKDQESSANYEKIGAELDEMAFAKWMTFLTSIICAIYGIAPDEINFESFSSKAGGLSGNDTEDKIISSKDKGLLPLLRYFEDTYSDFIIADFSDKYCLRFTGLDDEDEKQKFEEEQLVLTVNEFRARRGEEKIQASWGDAPLNPTLMGAWQAEMQAGQEDFGDPQGEAAEPEDEPGATDPAAPATPGAGGAPGGFGADTGQDFGGNTPGAEAGAEQDENGGKPASVADSTPGGKPFGKSFGLPIFTIEA